jgi:uncharacterized protein YukE
MAFDDAITYNPAPVADHAADIGARAAQLQVLKDDTENRTNTLVEFFAGHGATAYFDAQRQMLSGMQELIETVQAHGRTTTHVLDGAISTDNQIRGLF